MSRMAGRSVVLVVLLAMLPLLVPAAARATVDSGQESAFLAAIDQERAARGLPTLRRAGDLTTVARRHSVRMADRGAIYHNPDLGSEVSGWRTLGENVGRGPDAATIHQAFMDSPSHRDNILSASFVEVGVGVERRGDVVWVTQIFRVPESGPGPTPTAEPSPTASPGPPEATPAPTPTPTPAPTSGPSATAPRGGTGSTTAPRDAGVAPAIASPITAAPPPPPVIDRLTVTLAGIEAEDAGVTLSDALDLP